MKLAGNAVQWASTGRYKMLSELYEGAKVGIVIRVRCLGFSTERSSASSLV